MYNPKEISLLAKTNRMRAGNVLNQIITMKYSWDLDPLNI